MAQRCDPISWLLTLRAADLPSDVIDRARVLLRDLLGVAAAGSCTEAGWITAMVARTQFGSGEGPGVKLLFAQGQASASGMALAAASAIDAVDAHDGYREAKGHAGCATLAATLATLGADVAGDEFLTRLVIGYELGCRLGVALHATAADYHTSGAWMAPACAGIAARSLGLDTGSAREAMGIAEYHGPRSPMMRCIDHPTMVKDGSGWGAMAGVAAAVLAAAGFTGAPAATMTDPAVADVWADLGARWLIMDQYMKPEPICRWAQPAVHAAIGLRAVGGFSADRIVRVEVATFAAAARLAMGAPMTAEIAQYALAFPLAVALRHGAVGPADVTGAALCDEAVLRLTARVDTRIDPAFEAAFPARRVSAVTLTLDDGRRLESGPVEAAGDPERPLSDAATRAKFRAYGGPVLGAERTARIEAAVDALAEGPARALTALLGAGR